MMIIRKNTNILMSPKSIFRHFPTEIFAHKYEKVKPAKVNLFCIFRAFGSNVFAEQILAEAEMCF